jgi:methylenetetrahydrofolate--tRNA-(uracil-5-)-methyltransferase
MRHKRTPAHQTDSFGERVAAIHKERAGSFGAVATEARDAAPRFAADARGRGSASSRRTCAYRRSRCFLSRNSNAIESHPLISVQARRGRTDFLQQASSSLRLDRSPAKLLRTKSATSQVPVGFIFYDSIGLIVAADSIDISVTFRASRYGNSLDCTDDYINCPFNKEQYDAFLDAVRSRGHQDSITD